MMLTPCKEEAEARFVHVIQQGDQRSLVPAASLEEGLYHYDLED